MTDHPEAVSVSLRDEWEQPFTDEQIEKTRRDWRRDPSAYSYAAGRWIATVDRVRAGDGLERLDARPHDHDHTDCVSPGTTHRHAYKHEHPVEHIHEHEHPTDAMVEARLTAARPTPEPTDAR